MKSISYCLPVLFALLPACSGAPEASEPTEQDDAELRALKSTEILGDLSYGQTSSAVAYTETPLYSAYRFHGTAGDNVDAWIRSSDGDARAWLLRETFSTVTSNDNADSSTHDAHLTAKLAKTGTYYIAFREKNREDASITVTLNGTTPTEAGIWDPSHCDGAPLTQADLTHYFEPAGTFSDEVANVQVSTRRRVCNDVTGCNAWQEGAGALSWSSNNTVISQADSMRRSSPERPSIFVSPATVSTVLRRSAARSPARATSRPARSRTTAASARTASRRS